MNRWPIGRIAPGGQNAETYSRSPVRDVDGDPYHCRIGPAGRDRTGHPARRSRLKPAIVTPDQEHGHRHTPMSTTTQIMLLIAFATVLAILAFAAASVVLV